MMWTGWTIRITKLSEFGRSGREDILHNMVELLISKRYTYRESVGPDYNYSA